MNTFTLLISKYAVLLQEVSLNSNFKNYITFPLHLLSDDPEFGTIIKNTFIYFFLAPRVLLRSKCIPELEVNVPRIVLNTLDEQAIAKALQHWQYKTELHDALCTSALSIFEEVRDEYDFKMRVVNESSDRMDSSQSIVQQKEFLQKTLNYMHCGE